MSEGWLPVVGYEGLYEVSDRGRVRSLDRIVKRGSGTVRLRGRVLKAGIQRSSDGHQTGGRIVTLCRDGKRRTRLVHQLVVEAAVGTAITPPKGSNRMTDAIGPQYDQPDPRGWLVFHGLPDDLQRAEDSTRAADWERAHRNSEGLYFPLERPATDAERQLLQHLGYELPDQLTTKVRWITAGVRNRRWPQLENQERNP